MTFKKFARNSRGRASRQAGFTLLLAALVSSIVLALGSTLFTIATKQLALSSIGRDSQFAFYAADTAAECALYWDLRYSFFATSTPAGVSATCDTQAIHDTGRPTTAPYYPYTVVFTVEPHGYCATVEVKKTIDASGSLRTTIQSDGFSTPCETTGTSIRALQRTVQLHY